MAEQVVVAGAGFGGLGSALSLARKGYDVRLVDRKAFHSYTPGLIDLIRDRVAEDKLRLDLDEFLKGTGIEVLEQEISSIDPEEKIVETDQEELEYEKLVVALGAEIRDFGNDISELEKCYSFSDAKQLAEKSDDAEEALVVGAGYVGIEIAGELEEKGLDVEVVDMVTRPLPNSSEKASEIALSYMNRKGIDFKGGREVVNVSGKTLELEDGRKLSSDIVVWSTGIKCPELLQDSFDCGPGGLEVNSGLCCENFSDVFALGDCADHGFEKTAHHAMKMGETVAENISRKEKRPLKTYRGGFDPLVISLGDTAVMTHESFDHVNFLLRSVKDMIRIGYFLNLKKEKTASILFG